MKEIMLLYSHCILVDGAVRSTINDLQRQETYLIPKSFAMLFSAKRYLDLAAISASLDSSDSAAFSEYLYFLQKKELAFLCTEEALSSFPELNKAFLFAGSVSNCVLDAFSTLDYFNPSFLQQLNEVGCQFMQLRFYDVCTIPYLEQLLSYIAVSGIKSVELLIPFQSVPGFEKSVIDLLARHRKISGIVLHSATANAILKDKSQATGFIVKRVETITDATHCGLVNAGLFAINIPTYTEALQHNTCLNRKISIDANGYIKNCPSMKGHFGSITETTLGEALAHPAFKKYWNIGKDQVAVCCDCEFRYICTDCRAYVEEPDNDRSKPLKCGYDPYTTTWQDWASSPLKQAAILHYGMGSN